MGSGRSESPILCRRGSPGGNAGASVLLSHPRGPGRRVRALSPQLPPLYTSRDLREEKLRKSVLWYLSSPLDFSQVENSEMKIRFKGLLINFHVHDLSYCV